MCPPDGSGDPQPGPTFVLAVPNTSGSYPYLLRLGSQDTSIENKISADKNVVVDADSEWNKQGVLIYAADTISMIAPEIKQVIQSKTEWSSDKLEVTTTEAGLVQSAELSMSGAVAGYSAVASIDFVDGVQADFITGFEAKVVTGMGVTATTGMELKAVSGMETVVVDGWSTEMKNGHLEVVTPAVVVRLNEEHVHSCSGGLTLGAGAYENAMSSNANFKKMLLALRAINVIAGVTSTAASAIGGGVMDVTSGSVDERSDRIRAILKAQYYTGISLSALYVAAQALSIVANYLIVAKTVAKSGTSTLALTPDSATMGVGPTASVKVATLPADPSATARKAAMEAQLTAATATQTAMDSAYLMALVACPLGQITPELNSAIQDSNAADDAVNDLTQSVADATQAAAANNPAMSVYINGGYVSLEGATSITLKAGASTIALTDAGIVITAPEITFAGEDAITTNTPIKSFGPG